MRLLLCTDLDRTLLPNGAQPESVRARELFHSLVSRDEVTLGYVTGRHKALVEQAINDFQIPQPDFVIADVGSTIYKVEAQEWHRWQRWEAVIENDWAGKSHEDIHQAIKGVDHLRLQEQSKQNKHKLSYYVPMHVDHVSLLSEIKKHLDHLGVHVNLIWSIDEPANTGLLDVLPASAGKRQAIEFLMRDLKFSLNEAVFAGDSGNDISVMASPIHSVLVANASSEVKSLARLQANENGIENSLYIAKGDYLGMNGNCAAGILEGVVHYMPEIKKWIGDDDE